MDNLQQYIDLLKSKKDKAKAKAEQFENDLMYQTAEKYNALVEALSFAITNAQLLLSNKHTGAITEAAHSANTNVGRSAASDTTQSIGDGGADSSETAVVGQNEQVKEVCPHCSDYGWLTDDNGLKSTCQCHY